MTEQFEHITSPANARLRSLRRWHSRAQRERDNVVVIEGEDLVAAALDAGLAVRWLLIDHSRAQDVHELAARVDSSRVATITTAMLADVSELAYPPRVIAACDRPAFQANVSPQSPRIVLDGVHDPGNVGTLIRTAVALGVGVVLLPGSADPWSGKALRAAMGATFRAHLVRSGTCADACEDASCVVGLDAQAQVAIWDVQLGAAPTIVVGSERDGLSAQARGCVTHPCAIPFQDAGSESLNAGVAGSMAIYEWARQVAVLEPMRGEGGAP